MASYKAVLNHKVKNDGTQTILIQIIHNRKKSQISTGYSVKAHQFNPKATGGKYVRSSHLESVFINDRIREKITEAQKREAKLNSVSSQNIKQAIKGADGESFLDFADEVITNLTGNKAAYRTWKRYNTVINKLRAYLKDSDLPFTEFDHTFLEKYRAHLFSIGNKKNTIHSNLRTLRSILYRAIREGKFDQAKNPFFTFQMEKEKTGKAALTPDELERLQALELPENGGLWHTRNYFFLSYYFHGIRAGDLITLKRKNFIDGRLIYQMGKTGEIVSLKIPNHAHEILTRYLTPGLSQNDYVFPMLDNKINYSDQIYLFQQISSKNALVNKYLKKLAAKAGIHKNISFHVARSTFANIARAKIGDISKIQKFLRHSSIQVTQSYLAQISDTELDNDSDEIFS